VLKDVDYLHRSVRGFAKNSLKIISVLCNRTFEQRSDIGRCYKFNFNRSLAVELAQTENDAFNSLLISLEKSKYEFLADELHDGNYTNF
jgi:annexin A7/11